MSESTHLHARLALRLVLATVLIGAVLVTAAPAASAHGLLVNATATCQPDDNAYRVAWEVMGEIQDPADPAGNVDRVDAQFTTDPNLSDDGHRLDWAMLARKPFTAEQRRMSGVLFLPIDTDHLRVRAIAVGTWGDGQPAGDVWGRQVPLPDCRTFAATVTLSWSFSDHEEPVPTDGEAVVTLIHPESGDTRTWRFDGTGAPVEEDQPLMVLAGVYPETEVEISPPDGFACRGSFVFLTPDEETLTMGVHQTVACKTADVPEEPDEPEEPEEPPIEEPATPISTPRPTVPDDAPAVVPDEISGGPEAEPEPEAVAGEEEVLGTEREAEHGAGTGAVLPRTGAAVQPLTIVALGFLGTGLALLRTGRRASA